MTREELFEAFAKRLVRAYEKVNGKKAAALTLEFITGILGAVITAIRACRSPETAKAEMAAGSEITYLGARRILRDEGYRGKDLRRMAMEVVNEGKAMSEEELDALVDRAKDAPAPPVVITNSNSWWPIAILFCFLLCVSANAEDKKPAMWWPIDEEQNNRLSAHDEVISEIRAELKDIYQSLERLERKDRAQTIVATLPQKIIAAPQKTAVCQCQGSNKAVCHCLKNGMQCKCSATVGSVWNLDATGKAVSKTGQYVNPTNKKQVVSPQVAVAAVTVQPAQRQVTAIVTPQYAYVCDGRRCRKMRIR